MKKNDWKIMVYLSGDNDLGESMVSSITGLARLIGKTDRATVHVYYDSNVPEFPSVVFHFTAKNEGEVRSLDLEVDASEFSVYRFLDDCFSNQPSAEKHMLVLSGHGDAFQGDNFLRDSGGNSSVSMAGLSRVLRDIKNKHLDGKNFDIIGFDSCCMSGVEIATQIDRFADKMIASQGLTPHDGWNYAGMIDGMLKVYNSKAKDAISADRLCEIVVQSFSDYYSNRVEYCARSVDITVCDLKKFAGTDVSDEGVSGIAVTKAVNDLAAGLLDAFKGDAWGRQLKNAILAAHFNSQTYLFDQCVDVVDLAREIRSEIGDLAGDLKVRERLMIACDRVIESVERCCIVSVGGLEYQWSNGLSIYFPWSYLSYLVARKVYRTFDFANKTRLALNWPRRPTTNRRSGFEESSWVAFLDLFLLQTIKPDNESRYKAGIVKDLRPELQGLSALHFDGPSDRVNDPRDKVNDPKDKVNDPKDKVNDPYDRVNDPRDKLTMHRWENFRRMKNFPWRPLSYMPRDRMARKDA